LFVGTMVASAVNENKRLALEAVTQRRDPPPKEASPQSRVRIGVLRVSARPYTCAPGEAMTRIP
jgi:hypothetical protein